jgi:hypothetical protein
LPATASATLASPEASPVKAKARTSPRRKRVVVKYHESDDDSDADEKDGSERQPAKKTKVRLTLYVRTVRVS